MPVQPGIGCLFIGGQSLLILCAERALEKGYELRGIVTDDPAAQRWADEHDVPFLEPCNDLAARLGGMSFSYLFSVGYLARIPDEVLALPETAAVNFHDGPLPEYAGLNVTSWAILNREKEHGVTWHLMTRGLDRGDILKSRRFPISDGETAFTLNAKCLESGLACFDELIDDLRTGNPVATQQDFGKRRYFAKHRRLPGAGTVDWARPAEEISALVRALDFGPYPNPICTAKMWVGETPITIDSAELLAVASGQPPGTVVRFADDSLVVATGSNDLSIGGMATLDGRPVDCAYLAAKLGLQVGDKLHMPSPEELEKIGGVDAALHRQEEFWSSRLQDLEPLEVPFAHRPSGDESMSTERFAIELPSVGTDDPPGDILLAAVALYFGRIGGKQRYDISFSSTALDTAIDGAAALFASRVPLSIALDRNQPFADYLQAIRSQLASIREHTSFALDLPRRQPGMDTLREWQKSPVELTLRRVASVDDEETAGAGLTVFVPDAGDELLWLYRADMYDRSAIVRMQRQIEALLRDLQGPDSMIAALDILSAEDRQALFDEWNRTQTAYDRDASVHGLFEAQVARGPEETALLFRDDAVSYRALNEKANSIAHYLVANGVQPGKLVGILMDRSTDMIAAMMAVLKAGGAYVPLDPTYPADRLSYMAEDAGLAAVLCQEEYRGILAGVSVATMPLDRLAPELEGQPRTNLGIAVAPTDLAYVIYTSGSTGRPKGVMVEHRNVVNFFAGMDDRIASDDPGTWLAVTSISFDISVLELFWTLARGFRVVLHEGGDMRLVGSGAAAGANPVIGGGDGNTAEFSLFYFASDEAENDQDKYKLLLEGAKFGDRNGFVAVWTPERHFHAFGGLYPNPAVAGAAIAAITENIQIRSGSCVLPLHNPIRITEEWALVDNLSRGRVALGFASGWQPNDFVLAPQNYEDRHKVFYDGIETVKALWRGESVTFPGPRGDVEIKTLPRPIQTELPIWVTAAGNPETFRQAGQIGANVLTHLLGQSLEEVAEKIKVYRQARRDHGHVGEGRVTLMLHSFVSHDEAFVRESVHQPLKDYLNSATNLVKQYASSFPAFRNATADIDDILNGLTGEDLEAVLEHAFDRYYQTSGLFGTPEGCLDMVDAVVRAGVDEIACLIDFGVPSETVLENLPYLNDLRKLAELEARTRAAESRYSIPALIDRHAVTHLQCTPSLAGLLARPEQAREQLKRLSALMVGGEALPPDLAADLASLVPGPVINMYGPTETTIWSTTHRIDPSDTAVPIGKPIANTQIHILDADLQPVPVGVSGELAIGGEGVVRGYLNRQELTTERFVAAPFDPGERLYRTGDLARWRSDGLLEFLGRLDNQVKIRGYRIELGEIEAILTEHPAVRQAVVVAPDEGESDKRLVGYIQLEPGHEQPTVKELRAFLAKELPEFMVPAVFVTLEAFPMTPNKKLDRGNLPAPEGQRLSGLRSDYVAPRNDIERQLAEFWKEVLRVGDLGVFDDFFELGGDSLSAIEVFLKIQKTFSVVFPISVFFASPTVAGMAESLEAILDDVEEKEDVIEVMGDYG